jgi:hypothetical protein
MLASIPDDSDVIPVKSDLKQCQKQSCPCGKINQNGCGV